MSNGTSVMSPAMSLAHEMGHGAQHLDGKLNEKKLIKTETANLKKYETPIAKQLGEPRRASYFSHKGKIKMDNSTNFITTHPGKWGWFTPYIINHNQFQFAGASIRPAK